MKWFIGFLVLAGLAWWVGLIYHIHRASQQEQRDWEQHQRERAERNLW